jgi:nicotinic acid phosphoribosyltransferase
MMSRARPDNLVLLIDTYDTEAAARKVVALAPRLAAAGITVRSVRLDNGDLIALSRVRRILDDGGLTGVIIFASGGIDEDALSAFAREHAPIDGFGIGISLATCPTGLRSTVPTSCRKTTGCRGESSRPTRRHGRGASRCGGVMARTGGRPAIRCRSRMTFSRASP